jgi:protein-S-isoprenylcysteine O-methyltransferase Ste14
VLGQTIARPLLRRVRDFLVDRRVAITCLTFTGLGVCTLALHFPHRHSDELFAMPGLLATALVLGGVAVRSWAAGTLRKGIALTTTGPYLLCRHPLYLGTVLMMLGFFLLAFPIGWIWLGLAPIMTILLLTLLREEERLAVRYGDAWTAYALRTPRFLPTRIGIPHGAWSFAQWRRSREYRASSTALLALVAVLVWSATHGY